MREKLFRRWFRPKCEHDFRYVGEFWSSSERGTGYSVTILYCPKCDKEKRMPTDEYKKEKRKKRLKEEYQRTLLPKPNEGEK